ncbi:hypothetical protein LOK49_LG09G02819 [Camellia lanceoleosa]|uniref:Uncharacterized protein n=1 Tax=Camellia lanceoleosa TaxID=1840588 RepID=A0ACC0GJU2_9ERIC|nr:hypothetical protein LOK49_LG09G02819 [Camellia lanceoleosa]
MEKKPRIHLPRITATQLLPSQDLNLRDMKTKQSTDLIAPKRSTTLCLKIPTSVGIGGGEGGRPRIHLPRITAPQVLPSQDLNLRDMKTKQLTDWTASKRSTTLCLKIPTSVGIGGREGGGGSSRQVDDEKLANAFLRPSQNIFIAPKNTNHCSQW